MNWLSPAWRCAGSTGAVRASTMKACAWWAPEVQTLVPVSDQPPSTRCARVRTLARSEPESGSLMPMPKKHSPATIRGRNSRFCSSVPYFSSDGTICRSAIQCAATGAPAASSSSVTTNRSRNERPCPPYSFGTVMPSQPRAASAAVKVSSQPLSQLSTDGVNAPAASCSARKARTSARSAAVAAGSTVAGGTNRGSVTAGPPSAMRCWCSASWWASGCMAAAMPSVDSSDPVRDSCSRRLAIRRACGGFLTMRSASACAWVSRSSCGTTRLTMPHCSAVAASMRSPVKVISAARSWPMARGRNQLPPSPGIRPSCTKLSAKDARSEAIRMSHIIARSQPAPIGGPVDRGDQRHLQAAQRPRDPLDAVDVGAPLLDGVETEHALAVGHLLDVAAGGEDFAGSGEDDRADCVVGVGTIDGGLEGRDEPVSVIALPTCGRVIVQTWVAPMVATSKGALTVPPAVARIWSAGTPRSQRGRVRGRCRISCSRQTARQGCTCRH